MLAIINSVGKSGANRSHDVRLVQTALKLIKKANGQPYLTGKCDGQYGPQTLGAITAFQNDHVFSNGQNPPGETPDLIGTYGKTLATLTAKLPQEVRTMRIIPNTRTVYLGQPQLRYVASHGILHPYAELEPTFKNRLYQLNAKMFHDHGIVLSIPPDGWRRSFAEQAELYKRGRRNIPNEKKITDSAPGESNHQFGNAVDIGFDGLEWFDDEARLFKDDHWLNTMQLKSYARFIEFWNARDNIAFSYGLKKTTLAHDLIHLQSYDDSNFSMGKSMAAHLKTVSQQKTGHNHNWEVQLSGENTYTSDYGLGGKNYSVGTTQNIWQGNFSVEKEHLATALNAKLKANKSFDVAKFFGETAIGTQLTSYTAAQIKDAYVKTMKARITADIKAADEHWILWKPVKKT